MSKIKICLGPARSTALTLSAMMVCNGVKKDRNERLEKGQRK